MIAVVTQVYRKVGGKWDLLTQFVGQDMANLATQKKINNQSQNSQHRPITWPNRLEQCTNILYPLLWWKRMRWRQARPSTFCLNLLAKTWPISQHRKEINHKRIIRNTDPFLGQIYLSSATTYHVTSSDERGWDGTKQGLPTEFVGQDMANLTTQTKN